MPGFSVGRVRVLGGLQVHGNLAIVPGSFELLDQVTGRNYIDAETTHELDRARIDSRDVGIGVPRRILHRDVLGARDKLADSGFQLLPTEIYGFGTRQVIERGSFDPVDQLLGFAAGRDIVEPAPRTHLVVRKSDDAAS